MTRQDVAQKTEKWADWAGLASATDAAHFSISVQSPSIFNLGVGQFPPVRGGRFSLVKSILVTSNGEEEKLWILECGRTDSGTNVLIAVEFGRATVGRRPLFSRLFLSFSVCIFRIPMYRVRTEMERAEVEETQFKLRQC